MNAADTINRIRGGLGEHLLAFYPHAERRCYIDVPPEAVHEAAVLMFEEIGARLQIATGIDTPSGIEVMYHWALDQQDAVVTVRATVTHEDPVLDTITDVCDAAEWIEREIWELLGVEFRGHPDLRHLLLDDSWPEGNYPLRKQVHGKVPGAGRKAPAAEAVSAEAGVEAGCRQTGTSPAKGKKTIVPIGPYHALQEEPEFFKLHVEGETVVGLDIELGYNHRGIEKLSESKTYEETVFLVERICGICSTSHPIACVQAAEDAGHITVPERALFIRSIIGELERIHSHLLWLGLAGHFVGFNTLWMWAWRYREDVLNILELITGNRNHYGMMKPGGVRRDISDTDIPAISKLLTGLQDPIKIFRDAVIEDPLVHARTRGIGILSKEKAIAYGALGPTARASGYDIDVRRDHPHAAYDKVEWNVITTENGDVFDKAVVRILEMFESIRIVEQCLQALKTVRGPVDSDPACIPPGDGIGHYEAPRGEVFHYVRSDGGNRPVRHKVRAPSFMNVPTNLETVPGGTVADATIILAAVDPCYCCTERLAVAVDSASGRTLADARDLIRMGCEKTWRLMEESGLRGPQLELED